MSVTISPLEFSLRLLPTTTMVGPVLGDWDGFGRGVADVVIAAVSHLGWPAVAVMLALTFRKSVSQLLERIEFASWKDAKLMLGRRKLLDKLAQAEAMADALALPSALVPGRRAVDGVELAVKQCLNTAAKQPARAIVDGWQLLVESTCDLVEVQGGKRPSTTEWIAAVAGSVNTGTLQVINLLMSIQSEELSGGSVAVEKEQATRYINLVSRTQQVIQQAVHTPPNRREGTT